MRLLLDTNVLIAAFVSRGQCHELLEHAVRHHRLFTSIFIMQELGDKLSGKFRLPDSAVAQTLALLEPVMEVVVPAPLAEPACRDPDDDNVLAAAVAAAADVLVTGDRDLLEMEDYRGIPILLPADFWRFEARRERRR